MCQAHDGGSAFVARAARDEAGQLPYGRALDLISLGAADPLALSEQELNSAFGEWPPLARGVQQQRAQTDAYVYTETVEATNEQLATRNHSNSTWRPDGREHDECRELEEAARSVHRTLRYFLDVQLSAVGACVLLD